MYRLSGLLSKKASASPLRKELRGYLHLARRGDQEAYIKLSRHYLNLITEYVSCTGYESNLSKSEAVRDVVIGVWQTLPYTSRLSDFERTLVLNLLRLKPQKSSKTDDEKIAFLRSVDPTSRFILIAHEMENWKYPAISLATRISNVEIEPIIFDLRSQLLKFHFDNISVSSKNLIRQINKDLNGKLSLRSSRRLCRKTTHDDSAKEFKCRWLTFRCELVELRQQIRFNNTQRERFLQQLIPFLVDHHMRKPRLHERLLNQISFIRPPNPA
jgi:hypothetical protein